MVSNEEYERGINLFTAEVFDDAEAMDRLTAQYPDVIREQDRWLELRKSIKQKRNNTLSHLLGLHPEYASQLIHDEPLMHFAARHGNIEACELLLSAGANVNQLSKANRSILDHIELNIELYQFLFKSGVDPNRRAIFHVCSVYRNGSEEERLEIVKLFVKYGVEINRVYMMFVDPVVSQTVLDFAGDRYPRISEYLVKHGAKHSHELDRAGAYDGAHEYISYEQLKKINAKPKGRPKNPQSH